MAQERIFYDGFEGPFVYHEGISELEVPEGWAPAWVEGEQPGVNHRPEFKPERDRAFAGDVAAKFFTTHASHDACLCKMIKVRQGVPIFVEAWGATFTVKAGQALRLGIHPTGETDFLDGAVVWGDWWGQYNPDWEGEKFHRFEAECTPAGDSVAVFLHSRSDYAGSTVAAYWDEVSAWQETEDGGEPPPQPPGDWEQAMLGQLTRIADAVEKLTPTPET